MACLCGAAAISILLSGLLPCGCGRKAQPERKGAKVLIIGVDGADWVILDKLLAGGELPNFNRLIQEGSHGLLRSLEPILSPLIWTSVATGKTPDKHGILDFVVRDPSTGNQVPVASSMRRVAALWNMVSAWDRSTAFVGWWATWPAETVNGIIVSDRLSYHSAELGEANRRGLCSPPSYTAAAESIAASVARVPADVIRGFVDVGSEEIERARADSYDLTNPVNNLRLVYRTSETYRKIALDILSKEKPDLMAVYFEETDTVGHLFMPFAPPRRPDVTEEQVRRFGGAVEESYRHIDEAIGELIAAAGDEYCVIVLSDHGFKTGAARPRHTPAPREPGAADWHRLQGVLIMSGPQIKAGVGLEGASVIDITPTVLTLMGLPVAEDMDGRPLTEVMDEDFLREHRAEAIDSYERLLAERGDPVGHEPMESPMDEEMLNRLRALGYLGSGVKDGGRAGEEGVGEEPEGDAATGSAAVEEEKLPSWHLNKGVALLGEKRYAEAEEEFMAAASKDPTNPITFNNLGLTAMELRRPREAEARFKKAIDLAPGYVNAHINLAILYDRGRRDSLALSEYRTALELEPNRASIHSDVGSFFAKRGLFAEALPHFRKAVELEPLSAKYHRDIGAVFWNMGNLAGAEEHFREAVSIEPGSAQSHLLLAQVLLALRRNAEARTHLEKCLTLDPGNEEAKRLMGR
jgi:Tfp pilus assembly protein PilF